MLIGKLETRANGTVCVVGAERASDTCLTVVSVDSCFVLLDYSLIIPCLAVKWVS